MLLFSSLLTFYLRVDEETFSIFPSQDFHHSSYLGFAVGMHTVWSQAWKVTAGRLLTASVPAFCILLTQLCITTLQSSDSSLVLRYSKVQAQVAVVAEVCVCGGGCIMCPHKSRSANFCVCVCGCEIVCVLPPAAHAPLRRTAGMRAYSMSRISMKHTHTPTDRFTLTHQGLRGQRVSQSSKPLQRHSLKKEQVCILCVRVYVCVRGYASLCLCVHTESRGPAAVRG